MSKIKDISQVAQSSLSPQIRIVDGIIENLPEIIGAIKEVYSLNKREKAFDNIIKLKIEELHLDKDNFKTLVQALTDLSKDVNSDNETKEIYKDMIKKLFDIFLLNRKNTTDISNFLDKW